MNDVKDTHYIVNESENESGQRAITEVMEVILETVDYARLLESASLAGMHLTSWSNRPLLTFRLQLCAVQLSPGRSGKGARVRQPSSHPRL